MLFKKYSFILTLSLLSSTAFTAETCFNHETHPRQELISKSRSSCVAEAERFHICVTRACYKPEHFENIQYCKDVQFLSERYQIYEYCNAEFGISEPWNKPASYIIEKMK